MAEPLPAMPPALRLPVLAAASACLLPLLLQLPTGLALLLAALAVLGFATDRRWPAWFKALLMLVVAGYVFASHGFRIGRDTGCALLAAMLALKTIETRNLRDAHSLLGFSLFSPFAAFLQDQGPLTLALSVPAVAGVLLVLARLADGGDGAAARTGHRERLRRVGVALLMALPLAAAGFWLFPRLHAPLWGMPENALGRSGLGEDMTPDQWVDLFSNDEPALRVRFTGPVPPRGTLYWRAQILDTFDGRSWRRGVPAGPGPVAVAGGTAVDYVVTLEPTGRHYLVLLDLPEAAPEGHEFRTDATAAASVPVSQLTEYRATSRLGATLPRPLTEFERRVSLQLPTQANPRTRALGRQWRQELGGDDAAIVQRALDWIRRDFSYSLSVPPSGRDPMDDFLFETQVGFCQHFSSAFANLMRAAGIPSRIVLGYAGGYRNPFGDYWVVRSMDAHAWTEVWLEGRGWVRVDPTAAVAPERVLDTVEDLARAGQLLPEALSPVRDLADWVRRGWNDMVLGFDAARQARLFRPLGVDDANSLQLALGFGLGAAAALGLTLWLLLRGRQPPPDPLLRAWRRFTRRLARAGLAREAWEPPLAFGRRAATARPHEAEALASLSRRFADQRYAPAQSAAADRQALIRDLLAYRPRPPHR